MPVLSAAIRSPKRACTQSPSSQRDVRNASVAPMLDANEISRVPQPRPKMAPPARVSTTAPGSDSAVASTYRPKKIRAV